MKGETNNKRQAKLLAAVAVMAMVVCALAVAMPAEEADGVTAPSVPEGAESITTADGLANITGNKNYVISTDISIGEGQITIPTVTGSKIFINGGSIAVTGTGKLTINSTDLIIEVIDGSISGTAGDSFVPGTAKINFYNGASLTLAGEKLIGGSGFAFNNSSAQIVIKANGTGIAYTVETGTVTYNPTLATTHDGIYSNDTMTVNADATLIVTGGTAKVSGTIKNDGTITVQGAGVIDADASKITTTGIINGVFNASSTTGACKIYGTIAAAVAAESTIYVSGSYSESISINKDMTINFNDGSNYDGTVIWTTGDGINTDKYTQSVTLEVKDADGTEKIVTNTNGLSITGFDTTTTGVGFMTGSTITVTSMVSEVEPASATTPALKPIVIEDVVLGSMTLAAPVTVEGDVLIPSDTVFTFTTGAKMEVAKTDAANLYILGTLRSSVDVPNGGWIVKAAANTATVYAIDTDDVNIYSGIESTPLTNTQTFTIGTNDAALKAALQNAEPGMVFVILGTQNDAALDIDYPVDLNGVTITLGDSNYSVSMNIGTTSKGTTASITDSTINSGNPDSKIVVNKGSNLDIVDSKLFIVVEQKEGASIDVDNAGVVYENTSSDVSVGYGTRLVLTGNVSSIVGVYGELVIDSTANVPKGVTMTVYESGKVTVNGTLTILGKADFKSGSEAVVNGTVIVGNSTDGGSALIVDGDFAVESTGTVEITAVSDDNKNPNQLNVTSTGDEKFLVEGSLEMYGKMTGTVHDQGTIEFYGSTGDNAGIVLYDGVTLTVDYVKGTLTVSDNGIVDDLMVSDNNAVSDGNKVDLTNVSNVTFSETVETINYSVGTVNHRDYRTVMSISGEVSAITSGTIAVGYVDTPDAVGKDSDKVAYVNVPADSSMGFGDMVSLTVGGSLVVDGTVTFLKADNDDSKQVSGSGTLTVNGKMDVTEGMMKMTKVNAAMYVTKITGTNPTTIYTYTNFKAAVDAAPQATPKTVNVMGSIAAGETVDIPEGITVSMANNAMLTVSEDVTVVFKDGSKLIGSATNSIEVGGTLTVEDVSDMTLQQKYVHSDVIIDETPKMTWTSLSNAMDLGMTDIVLNRDITIDEDLLIPEGTTVTTVYGVTVTDDATLTVDGALVKDYSATTAGKTIAYADGNIVVGGVVSEKVLGDVTAGVYFNGVGGAQYAITSGAYTTKYVSSLAIAATNVNGNTNVVGDTVYITGNIGAGDVGFSAAEADEVIISMVAGTENAPTTLTMGTLTFDGKVSLIVGDDAEFTGTVSLPYGDGTTDAQIALDGAGMITVAATSQIGAIGTDYYAGIGSTGFVGDMEVASGTVTLGNFTVATGSSVEVASGAFLNVPSGITLTIAVPQTGYDIDPVTIDGTMVLDGTIAVSGATYMIVNGTLDIQKKEASVPANLTVYNNGTIAVADGSVLKIDGRLVVGEKPSELGSTGSVTGAVSISSGKYIIAYAGTDMSGASINWNTALDKSNAKATTYYVNGMEYATVYAMGSVSITMPFATEVIDITGYAGSNTWYASAEDADRSENPVTGDIGRYDAVYTELSVLSVPGVISKDAGVILTIDGLVVGSNGDVSQTITKSLSIGTHTIAWSERTGYDISNVTVTFNGVAVENGGTITITADMQSFTIIADGAVPGAAPVDSDDGGMGLTDYLLIILVVLIVVMAIMVALRLMRS